jgi:predicted RNA-binding Zn ribbon-like protein
MNKATTMLLPGEPVPVRLMNTIWADRTGVHDALRTVADLRGWLATVDDRSGSGRLGRTDLTAFVTLRDALRRLAAFRTDDTRAGAASATAELRHAVADVNDAARQATTWQRLTLRDGKLGRQSASTASAAMQRLSSIAGLGIDLLSGEETQLRACYAPGCVLYFVQDHPRREWCSTGCGNRVRAARHYRRHRG